MESSINIEVRYNETDQMGVVYHGNYVVWLELGRTKFLKDVGYSYADIESRGVIFPVRNVNIEYLIPCRYGETITVHTKVKQSTNIKTVYQHTITGPNNETKANAETTVVCVDRETFKPVRMRSVVPEIFEAYQKFAGKE